MCMYGQWSYIASDTHAIKVIASCKIANGSEICWKTFKRINGPECQCRRICLRITSVRLDASQEWLVIFSVKFSCHRHTFGAYHVTLALTPHTHTHSLTHINTHTHVGLLTNQANASKNFEISHPKSIDLDSREAYNFQCC